MKLKILNTREIKDILKKIKDLYGFTPKIDDAFLMDAKQKIYLISKKINMIDFEQLHINSMGLYFADINKYDELRLSIEGSQIVGPHAEKNILELNEEQVRAYFRSEEIPMDEKDTPFVLLKYNADFFGASKIKEGKLLNYLPKAHRTKELIL